MDAVPPAGESSMSAEAKLALKRRNFFGIDFFLDGDPSDLDSTKLKSANNMAGKSNSPGPSRWKILADGIRRKQWSRVLRLSLLLLIATVVIQQTHSQFLNTGRSSFCNCEDFLKNGKVHEELESLRRSLAEKETEAASWKSKATDLDLALTSLRLLRKDEKSDKWKNLNLEIQDGAKATDLISKCGELAGKVIAPQGVVIWKGYACQASDEEIAQYLNYEPRGVCPDDWLFVQKLVYDYNCFALPKRRCTNKTPKIIQNPVPFPKSVFSKDIFDNDAVRWNAHSCKSFQCLQSRVVGDCRGCFDFDEEWARWTMPSERKVVTLNDVLEAKKGRLRLGLDVGGGTGSFAAHMALHNCTIITTAYNVETVGGLGGGLPYMEAISLRGLLPLHLPHKARLPFYDNTLDIVHSVNSIKYVPLIEFEELLFEWDRVLRPAGVMWFEKFYTPADEMALYVSVIELIGYKKLFWNITRKSDAAEAGGPHVYLDCLLEKPERLD